MSLTNDQKDGLRLIARSKYNDAGWADCNPIIFKELVRILPTELIETQEINGIVQIRMSNEGRIVFKWL